MALGLSSNADGIRTRQMAAPATGPAPDSAGPTGTVALSNVSGADDLKAIEALTGTSGLLAKTAANTWALRTLTLSTEADAFLALSNAAGVAGDPLLDLDTQSANRVFAGPTSGGAAKPAFRALVAADLGTTLAPTFASLNLPVAAGGVITGPLLKSGARWMHDTTPTDALLPDAYNLFIGYQAGPVSIAASGSGNGSNNLALGSQALQSLTQGYYNFALGNFSLFSCTTGNRNCGLGINALEQLTTGEENIGIGNQAATNTITGSRNTAVGSTALIVEGDDNTAIGASALLSGSLTPILRSVAVGALALSGLQSGNDNIAIGYEAAVGQTAGSGNIIIGRSLDADSLTGSNQLVLGQWMRGTASTTRLIKLTSNGFVKTSGGDGTLSVDTTSYAPAGAITASGLRMATARLLGRTTATTGAIEELTAGSSLSLSGGSLDAIQDIRTSATPNFAGLQLGSVSTDATLDFSDGGTINFGAGANATIAFNGQTFLFQGAGTALTVALNDSTGDLLFVTGTGGSPTMEFAGANTGVDLTLDDGSGSMVLTPGGSGKVQLAGITVHKNYTVAGLPTASSYAYAIAIVTDATLTAITGLGLAPTGGGSNVVPVYSNGTSWVML